MKEVKYELHVALIRTIHKSLCANNILYGVLSKNMYNPIEGAMIFLDDVVNDKLGR